ncbi:uncharacterized protein LODBEIA_P03560 [Lodderomyces beijingensis]|uniref:Gag1-like clamp domain-containing protein n=1 Tax=Lodderomyces beijingensis TaxID=1775926 RepID=A0ABP0ZD84_9ASCO
MSNQVQSYDTIKQADTIRIKKPSFPLLRKAQSTPKLRNTSSNLSPSPVKKKKKTHLSPLGTNNNTNTPTSSAAYTTVSTVASTPAVPSKKKSSATLNTAPPPAPTIASTTITSSTASPGFFKKISNFIHKLKSLSEEVFNAEDIVEELFVDSEVDDQLTFDKIVKSNKGYQSAEEKFLQEYKKFKSLDKMYSYYNPELGQHSHTGRSSHDNNSSTTMVSEPSNSKIRTTLQDVIRLQSQQCQRYQNLDEFDSDDDSDIEAEERSGESSSSSSDVKFQQIDFAALRREFEHSLTTNNNSDSDANSRTTTTTKVHHHHHQHNHHHHSKPQSNSVNVGSILWEYRRLKWLEATNNPRKIRERVAASSISYIPKENYVKVYTSLVEKNKCLKDDKHINLGDLIEIINAGWIAEERWERAARGVA